MNARAILLVTGLAAIASVAIWRSGSTPAAMPSRAPAVARIPVARGEPGPDTAVVHVSIPGMHCPVSCVSNVTSALESLDFVDPASIHAELSAREVALRTKPGKTFDLDAARRALAAAGYRQAETVSRP